MLKFIPKFNMAKIISYLKKVFGSKVIDLSMIAYFLTKCAKAHSYVETLGKHADSLHTWIKSSYEEDFRREFERIVRCTINKLRIPVAQLAFDITYVPFYGNKRNPFIFNTSKEKKYRGEFHFITCCLINHGKQIPLMALPVRLGEQTKLTIDLLCFCMSLFKNIRCCLFDRGFYNAELIDFLEAKKINYLMLVPHKRGKISSYIEETEELGKFKHQMCYSKKKSKWKPITQITICKNINNFDWIFATNIQFDRAIDYIFLYKRRWQIETNYRVEDEAEIKSKSSNYLIRYFYFLIGLLLHLLWIVHKIFHFYAPFKKYLDVIEHELLFNFLRISSI